jgi:NAD(P)H-hydrate epimerase
MLEPLYTAAEMKAAEAGHEVPTLMERAGRAVAEEVLRRWPDARAFGAVCGGGANGGDGRIALEVLRAAGRETAEGTAGDVLIDALFGTGFHGEPRREAAAQIEALNAAGRPVVAVDLPSGVNADTGEIDGVAVRADVTVTMHARKVGLEVAPGRFNAGEVVVADIGLEQRETATRLVTQDVLRLVPAKGDRDNKYSAGAVLVVGGSPGLGGAVTLTATAAFRADAGYVTVCSDEQPQLLEAVKRPLADALEASEKHGALAIGPGLGRGEERRALVRRLLEETDLPAVVDADGLDGLEPFARTAPTVLTPHAGELGRLLGRESAEIDAHRLEAVREAAARFGCVCLLKGADTLVAAPGEGMLVARLTHPSLATAGTGDVLTGVVAAFLAKGMDPRFAAAAGALACDRAAGLAPRRGLVASDVAALLPRALD